jgi:choice-of-anchor A domain-containing protein
MRNSVGKTFALAAASAAGLSVGMVHQASAQTYNAYAILGAFDVIVPGTYESGNDIEGAAVIGTLDGGLSSGGTMLFASNYHSSTDGSLTLTDTVTSQQTTYGSLNIQTINSTSNPSGNPPQTPVAAVNAATGTFADIGSNPGNVPVTINGCTVNCVRSTPTLNMSAFTTPLNNLQTSLAGLTANMSYALSGSNLTFALSNTNTVNIFNIDASVLNLATNILITGTAGTVVINVIGTTLNNTAESMHLAGGIVQNNIVWNFENATNITINNWEGTLLAGGATVTNYNPIEGTLYALNFDGHGEVHDYPFQPFVPPTTPSSPPSPPPVPEPGSMAILASGLAAAAAFRRGKKSA